MQWNLLGKAPIDVSAVVIDPFDEFAAAVPRVTKGRGKKRALRPTAQDALWRRIREDCFVPAFATTTSLEFASVVQRVVPGFWNRMLALRDLEKPKASARHIRAPPAESIERLSMRLAEELGASWEDAVNDSFHLIQKSHQMRGELKARGMAVSDEIIQSSVAASRIWLWALGCANALAEEKSEHPLANELLRSLLMQMGEQAFVMMRAELNSLEGAIEATAIVSRGADDEDQALESEAAVSGEDAVAKVER